MIRHTCACLYTLKGSHLPGTVYIALNKGIGLSLKETLNHQGRNSILMETLTPSKLQGLPLTRNIITEKKRWVVFKR